MALGGSPKQLPPRRSSQSGHIKLGTRGLAAAATPEEIFAIVTHKTWHWGARRSSHPPRRSSQSRHIKLGTRGLAEGATPEAFFAIAAYKIWHSGASRSSPPRGVLRNRDT